MTTLAVLIPVLGRPHRVAPLLASLEASCRAPLRPVFLCSPGDAAEVAAVRAAGLEPRVVPWEPARGDYARKMNLGFREGEEEWFFLAADDLAFRAGWFEASLAVHARTRACVVGTNDLGNRRVVAGHHSTHTLVHRDYRECGTVDEAGKLLHEGYHHNFVDDEFVGTAMWRRTWAFASRARVEHLHPDWGKGEWDETYRIGKATMLADKGTFDERRHLWGR